MKVFARPRQQNFWTVVVVYLISWGIHAKGQQSPEDEIAVIAQAGRDLSASADVEAASYSGGSPPKRRRKTKRRKQAQKERVRYEDDYYYDRDDEYGSPKAPAQSYNAPAPSYEAPSPSYAAPSAAHYDAPSYSSPSYSAPSYGSSGSKQERKKRASPSAPNDQDWQPWGENAMLGLTNGPKAKRDKALCQEFTACLMYQRKWNEILITEVTHSDVIDKLLTSFNSGSHVKGRPIYYVVEEPDSLHSDRSPYAYEPADPSLGQSELPSRVDSGNTFADPQAASDYVIKEHTYSMCPGCPTFSIPIPVPKGTTSVSSSEAHPALNGQAPYDYEASAAEDNGAYPPSTGFLGQITSSMLASANKVKELAAQFLSPFAANSVELQAGLVEKQDVATNSGVSSQLMAGGLAAALVGGLALLSSAATLATFSSGNPVSSLEARKLATPLQRNSACFFARTCQQLQSDAHTSEIDAMLHKITNQFCERVLEGENPCS
eukprot:maker-scaffold300_size216557-snap-gene-1.28 protein:Tk07147 transcript:maker-scaffold300_size216557-snap-gene-1.28-mRNA-1 annotation:"hypothetical protein DAPPUDRAFT_313644"